MNGINNITFGKRSNNSNAADNKKNHKRNVKIAVAAGVAAAAIGGIALYKNRNSKPVLKFRNFIEDGVMSPLKEKNIPVKKKISNVWNNLKDSIKGLKTKPGKYSDTIEIKNPKVQPEPKINLEINDAIKSAEPEIKKTTADKTADKAAKTASNVKNASSNMAHHIKHTGTSVLNAAKNQARNLGVAAGTAAVVTGGVVAGGKIGDAVQESKEKSFSIEYKGKAFKGELKDGTAFDENNKPLNGALTIKYNSGKKVVIDYKDGKLCMSILFKNADDTIPETIRVYDNGRIVNKHNDLIHRPNGSDKDFISRAVETFDNNDLMLQSKTEYLEDTGKSFRKKHFIKNLDNNKKIQGAPINTFSAEVKENNDGSTIKKIFIPVNGADKLIRTSSKAQDGSFDITLFGLNGEDIAQLSTDSDKKAIAYWHSAGDKDCSVIEIEDGRIAADNYEDAAINAVLLPDSTENLARFMANDGSVIEIKCNDREICSISSYANDTDKTPKTEMLFKDGRAFYDIWYNKDGEIIFKVNH